MTEEELYELANEYLEYNQDTGIMKWKKDRRSARAGNIIGTVTQGGYLCLSFYSKQYSVHRMGWFLAYGVFPDGQIDHINQDRQDNRLVNLRDVTPGENCKNKGIDTRNTSGVTGVYWNKLAKKWKPSINVDGEYIHLGYFVNFSDAVNARKNAEVLYGFHTNHGKD